MAAALTVLSGCTIPTAQDDAAPAPLPATPAAVETSAETPAAPEPEQAVPERVAQSFAAFSEGLGGVVGIAVAPVGESVGGDPAVQVAGAWSTGAAWSTIKVPLAIAALNESGDGGGLESAASAAITVSDNAAAEQLWASLGSPEEAALAVEGVLQQFGDLSTVVPSSRARPEYSIFG